MLALRIKMFEQQFEVVKTHNFFEDDLYSRHCNAAVILGRVSSST